MTKYKYSRLQIANRAKEIKYTWEQLGKDLFAKLDIEQPKKVKKIVEQQKFYEKGYKDGVEFCKRTILEKFTEAGYKLNIKL